MQSGKGSHSLLWEVRRMGQGRNGGKGYDEAGSEGVIRGMLRVKREESDLGAVRSHGNQGGICGWTSEAKQQNLCGGVAWQDPSLLQLAPLLRPFSAVMAPALPVS